MRLQVEGVPRHSVRVHRPGAREFNLEEEEVPRDCGTSSWIEELRPPEGQAFLGNCQVRNMIMQMGTHFARTGGDDLYEISARKMPFSTDPQPRV